ncbi:MAG: peptide deformylase [Acidimicrobiia bacterium]|nr:peptide deformylase [Acidimicrobiia bacterium]
MAETPMSAAPVEATAEPIPLRFFGDQMLRRVCEPVTDITGDIIELAERMLVTMQVEEGVGLAGPQVGRTLRIFTHALPDLAPPVLINPEIVDLHGEWSYSEGCLSIPGMHYELVRPGTVHLRAWTIEGEEVEIEADELLARVLQHENDHLDGVLFVDRLTGAARAEATDILAARVAGTLGTSDPLLTGRAIPGLRKPRSA